MLIFSKSLFTVCFLVVSVNVRQKSLMNMSHRSSCSGRTPCVTDDRNRACTHSAKAKPEGSDEVRNCHCKSREHDAETSHA